MRLRDCCVGLFSLCLFVLGGYGRSDAAAGWSPTGEMTAARASATTTLLLDGRTLVAGGEGASGALASAEVYANGAYSAVAPMAHARAGHSATRLADGRVLVSGGRNAGGTLASAEVFDPAAGTWSAAGSLADARWGHVTIPLPDGRVLIAGGAVGSGARVSVELFDPASATFALAGPMSVARRGHAAAALPDGRIFIVGGSDGSQTLASTEIYDPVAGASSPGPSLSGPRSGHSATSLTDGRVLVAGGTDGASDLASAEVFDATTGTFTLVPVPMSTPRSGHMALLLPGHGGVLLAGGISNGSVSNTAEIFAPAASRFVAAGSMTAPRVNGAITPSGEEGQVLVAGGDGLAGSELYAFPTVRTGDNDYPPGRTVVMVGKGWAPGETIELVLREHPHTHEPHTLTAVASADGAFVNTQYVTEEADLGVRFTLIATGQTSGHVAQTTFTDSHTSGGAGTQYIITSSTGTLTAGGTDIGNHCDDCITTVALPFPYTLYDRTFSSVQVHANGLLSFEAADFGSWSNSCLPNGTFSYAIYPHWDDLVTTPSSIGLGIFRSVLGTAPNRTFVIRWRAAPRGLTSFRMEFEVRLHEGQRKFDIVYGPVAFSGSSATSGVQQARGTSFTQYSCNTSELLNGVRLTFEASTGPVSTTTNVFTSVSPSNFGQPVTLTASVRAGGTIVTAGTVRFREGAVFLTGPLALNAAGQTSFTTSSLTAGSHLIVAEYSGSASHLPSSGSWTQVVNPPLNRAPIANNDSYVVNEDAVLSVPAPGVLGNDTDPDGNPLTAVLVTSPTRGTLSLAANGSFVYQPNPNVFGSDSFSYRANDGDLSSSPATVTITINPVNDAPVAHGQSVVTAEDALLPITLTGSDVEGAPLTFQVTVPPQFGKVTGTPPSLVYTPEANYGGPDSFKFVAKETLATSVPATVSITVTPVNDPPSFNAIADQTTPSSSSPHLVPITGVSAGPWESGQTVTFSGTSSNPAVATDPVFSLGVQPTVTAVLFGGPGDQHARSVVHDGTALYVASTDTGEWKGLVTRHPIPAGPPVWTSTMPSLSELSGIATLGTDVFGVGSAHAPVCGISANPAFPMSTLVHLDAASGAILTCQSPSFFSYGETGHWHFGAAAAGGHLYTVGKAMSCAGDNMLFTLSKYDAAGTRLGVTSEPGTALPGGAPCLGTSQAADITSMNGHLYVVGSSHLWNEGSVAHPILMKYTTDLARVWKVRPAAPGAGGFAGVAAADGYVYAVGFRNNGANSADYLVEKYDAAGTRVWSRTFGGTWEDVLKAAVIVEGRLFAIGYTRSFGVGSGDDADAVILEIDPSNGDVLFTTTYGGAGDDVAEDVVAHGNDVYVVGATRNLGGGNPFGHLDALILRYAPGTVATLLYVPQAVGTAVITVTADDGQAQNNTFTRTFQATVRNRPPVAEADQATTAEDAETTIAVVANDSDPEGATVAVAGFTAPAHGSVSQSADGSLRYTPEADFNGVDSFTYMVTDGDLASAPATVTVTVSPVNDAPSATEQTVWAEEDQPLALTLGATDVDGPTSFTFQITVSPEHGTLSGALPTVTYTPDANYFGPDSFTFTAHDGELTSAPAAVTIDVRPVNDAPVVLDQTVTTAEDSALTFTLQASDVDGPAPLALRVLAGPGPQWLGGANMPDVDFFPDPNFNGTAAFVVQVIDASGLESAPATITVHVTPVNDAPELAEHPDEMGQEGTPVVVFPTLFKDVDIGDTLTVTIDSGAGPQPVPLRDPSEQFWGEWLAHVDVYPTFADNGRHPVTTCVSDGTTSTCATYFVDVANVAPTFVFNGPPDPIMADEGSLATWTAAIEDPGADTWTATVDYGDGSGPQPLVINPDKTFQLSHVYRDDGFYSGDIVVTDDDGGTAWHWPGAVIQNVAPIVDVGPDFTVVEGAPVTRCLTFTDPGQDTHTMYTYPGEEPLVPQNQEQPCTSHTYSDNGTYTWEAWVQDDDGGFGIDSATVTVLNAAPVVTSLTGPTGPLAVSQAATVHATFTDPSRADTHTCHFDWDDGQQETLSPLEAGSCQSTHAYAVAGVHTVRVTVTDDDGGSALAAFEYVVVYDATQGFVTGGGTIDSPPGAYAADPSLAGRASFGFVAKYQHGASVPTGQTQFQFRSAGFNFHASTYEWLVTAGAKAQYKGTGTVNGEGSFGFMVTARDGQRPGGGGVDAFRLKVWDKTTGVVVYDNVLGASDDMDVADPQAITSGSIVIHP